MIPMDTYEHKNYNQVIQAIQKGWIYLNGHNPRKTEKRYLEQFSPLGLEVTRYLRRQGYISGL